MMSVYAEVVLSLPLTQTFTYIVPDAYQNLAKIGSRVLVPFHRRSLTGFIVGLRKRRKTKDYDLREIQDVLDAKPIFSPDFLSFTQELSAHHFSSWGEMLQSSLPPSYVPKSRTRVGLTEQGKLAIQHDSLSEEERRVLRLLQRGFYSRAYVKRKARVDHLSSLISRMEKKGFIQVKSEVKKSIRRRKKTDALSPVQLEMDFSVDEKSLQAIDSISKLVGKEVFSPFYLHAPQEAREAVYFNLIRKVLDVEKTVLFLVPEISLTKTLQAKFEKRFGEKAALFHSQLSEKKREGEWERINEGRADVVAGARSALFSPLTNVGMIIVDEEQDDSYYQRESPSYDARKGAWLRAKKASSILIYGSSMPSVEAYYCARNEGYLLRLGEKSDKRRVEFVGDRPKNGVIADRVVQRIEENLWGKESTLVFFNRRGYVSFLVCPRCRYMPRCTRCDVAMSYHKKEEKLVCHYCGHSTVKQDVCPECGSWIRLGRSFGIEVVEEELRRKFPQSRVKSFDTDDVRSKKEQERILSQFEKKKIDILLGTQLLAHQMSLSPTALVIILYPELLLTLPDFRASQKTFQAVYQMAKFINRHGVAEILIQTSVPVHYSIRCAAFEDYDSFYSQEIKYRRIMNYPPFSHVAEVVLTGENLRTLAKESRNFSSLVREQDAQIETLGPALASLARIRGKYRVQVVLKAKKKRTLNRVLRESLKRVKSRKTVFLYG